MSGTWGGLVVIPAEMRADEGMPVAELLAESFLGQAAEQGYHPAGVPELAWHEITQTEVDDLTTWFGGAPYKAGDWRVRCLLSVAEDDPL